MSAAVYHLHHQSLRTHNRQEKEKEKKKTKQFKWKDADHDAISQDASEYPSGLNIIVAIHSTLKSAGINAEEKAEPKKTNLEKRIEKSERAHL